MRKAVRIELSVVRAAKQYLELGIEPVPVQPRDKAAVHDWKTAPPVTAENVVSRFREGQNIGVRLGRRSGGLVDIDLDCDEAIKLAQSFLPSTGRIFGGASSRRAHWLYRSDLYESEETAALQYKHPVTKEMLIELRIGSDGHDAMTVIPPSIHKGTGENITWHEEGEIALVGGATLKVAVIKIAVGCLLLRSYPDEGGRHDFWVTVDGYLTRAGWSKGERRELIEIVAAAAGDDESKDRVRVGDRTEEKLDRNAKVRGLPAMRILLGKEIADKIDEWLRPNRREGAFSDVTKDGHPRATFPNTVVAIGLLGVKCRYDLLKLECIVKGAGLGDDQGRASDVVLLRLRELIHDRFKFDPKTDAVKDAVFLLANRDKFNPVRDYLDALEWDGVPRIDTWLTTYGGAEDMPFVRAVGAILLTAMVRRVRQPGCKFDEIVVLEGEQGTERSTALSVLAVRPEWFTDSVRLNMKDKEVIEQLQGKWIVEIAELGGMKKAEVEHVKALASRTRDRARLSYDKLTTEAPRQCVFIATTNESEYLRDQTGNRRFWPVRCVKFDLKMLMRDRDQLLAEAAVREAAGASIRLPEELWATAAEQQQERTIEEPWVATLVDLLKDEYGNLLEGKIRINDLWTILGVQPGRQNQTHNQRLGVAMKEVGWSRDRLRFDRKRDYCYVRGDGPKDELKQIYVERFEGQLRISYNKPPDYSEYPNY
jgi:predicted P-loop ATPase